MIIHSRKAIRKVVTPVEKEQPRIVKPERKKKVYREIVKQPTVIVEQPKEEKLGE